MIKHSTNTREDVLSPLELKDILDRLIQEEHEYKEIKLSTVRKLTADMTERGRKLGTNLEAIHSYVVKDCSNMEEGQDQKENCLSEELADEIRKRTTSVDSEIKQLENQMGQLQRTLVKGKARRESIRHRMSASSPAGGRKGSSISSSCSSMPEDEELSSEDYKSKIELLENEKLELLEDKKDLNDEIKFLKYQLQYRLEVQTLQNEHDSKTEPHIKLEDENKTLREENAKLKERFTKIKKKLEESDHVEESLLSMTDVPDATDSSALIENEMDRMHTERKILLSTIMRMQSMEKDEDDEVSYADFGVQCNLMKIENMEEKSVTPLVAKLTKENKALKKHITDMQNEIDEREEESKTLDEENYKLTEEKRTLEDTINKLRTQINETLDTTLDEIEHLHSFNEDLEVKFERTEAKNKEVLQALKELQNTNCKTLENLLDQVENKSTMEEVFEYLDREVGKLIEENSSLTVESGEKKAVQERNEGKQFTSNLLHEVKTCKELLESQRSHIRNLQLEKRDIEEGYTKMKRELLLLKSSKQRARENSKELQFLKKRRVKSLNDGTLGGIETKDVLVDKESLQREVKRLGAVKTQLENNVQKLKKEKATLEDEKVCLLGSLYHQLERNESLEIQIEELTVALEQWEAKADLENEVFERKTEEEIKESSESAEEDLPGKVKVEENQKSIEKHVTSEELPGRLDEESIAPAPALALARLETESNGSLDTEDIDNTRPTSPVVSVVSSAAEESLQELKHKIHCLGEQLHNVQESVNGLETERDKLQEDLDESKKNEKELRNVIIQLKRENGIHLDKLAKTNERAETLQVRLREANEAKEEAMESLEEVNEEKFVCKRHSEVLDKRLQEVTKQRDDYRNEVNVLNEKTKDYQQNIKEIHELIDKINNSQEEDTDSGKEEEESTESGAKEDDQKESFVGLIAVLNKVNEMKKKHDEKCIECDVLKNQLSALNTEKEALHKSVREIDDKKKQMKGFIAKLTEEKEKVTEQLDEMRQQKNNLADALENVYQIKEKLQNRFGEALCKQEQYKRSLVEALDEVKNLKESLCRVVNEHETMKESLLEANREVERLKSEQQHHKTELDVILEEEDKEMQDQNEKELTSENLAIADDKYEDDKDPNNNKDDLLKIIKRLKESLALLSEEKSKFETRVKILLSCKERINDDTGDSTEVKESKESEPQTKCVDELNNKSLESGDNSDTPKHSEDTHICTQLSRNEIISEVDKQAVQLEAIIEKLSSQLQYFTCKLREQDTVDKEHLMEWFEVISTEKEKLERELESSFKNHLELLQDIEKMRDEKERIRCQLRRALAIMESDLCNGKPNELDNKEMKEDVEMSTKLQEKESKEDAIPEEVNELINKLQMMVKTKNDRLNDKELEITQLLQQTKELQEENNSLNEKAVEILENSKHFAFSEEDLKKSITETEALEKQVEVLSNEGATLKGEADERVQRLIELEEKMIATMEKKLELAEYAKALKSQKDSLEKNCEQLSREVKGLKMSRDQLLAGKGELDEKLKTEIKMLKAYKDKSIEEIHELNKQLMDRKQDLETVESKLKSEEKERKALKEDLEKSAMRETELLNKTSELEQNAAKITKELQELSKENEGLNELLSRLIVVFEKEITGKESACPESSNNMEAKKKKVYELQEWIMHVNDELKNQTNETNFLNSFVQHMDIKISEVLDEEGMAIEKMSTGVEKESEVPQKKDNCDAIRCKLERLIEKLKERFGNNVSYQSELEQIREDNERISKELTSKSEFVQTMRDSYEQLLQERNVLAQKAAEEAIKMEEEKRETNEADGPLTIHRHICNNCKKLEKDYDDLNTKYLNMNKESSELVEKCRHLKEQLILLKQQQEDDEKEETRNTSEDLVVPEHVPEHVEEYQAKPDTSMENGIKEIMHQHQREKNELKKEIKQLENELNDSKQEKEEMQALVISLRSEIEKPQHKEPMHKSDDSVQLHKTLAERSSSVKDLNEKLGVSKNFMQNILDENTDLKENVVMLEKEAKDMTKETEVLRAEIDFKKRALIQAKQEASITESHNRKLEEEFASLKEQLKTRGNLLTTLEKDKETFKVSLREAQSEVTSLKKQNSELTDLLNSGDQRRLETENLVKKLKQSCDEMTAKFENATAEKKRNEELLEHEKEQTDELKGKLEKLESMYDKTKEKVEDLTAELRKDKVRRDRDIGSMKQENAKLLADEGRADRECDSLRQQLDEERQKNECLAEDLKELNKEKKHLKKNLQLESDEKLKTTEELKENKKEGRRLSTLTGDLKSKIANLEAIITAVKKENEHFKEEFDRAKENSADLRIRLIEVDEDKEELEKTIDELREKRQKLYDEIDKTLAERDDFEDELIETKKEMTKEIQSLVKENRQTNDKVQQLENIEISLRKELEEYKQLKAAIAGENQHLKENLEKVKTELETYQAKDVNTKPETTLSSSQEKEDYIRQLKEGQYEIKKLTCALEKSKKEIDKLKSEYQKLKEMEREDKRVVKEEMVVAEGMTSLEACADVDKVEKQDEPSLSLEEQISKYMIENMRLRARLEESDCKLMTLQGDLYKISKEGVQGELKVVTLQRECKTLRQTVQKHKEKEDHMKTALQASNSVQAELRRRLRNAVIDKDKYEQECRKLMLEKGQIEKVTVTSIEMPAVSQIKAELGRDHLAKAQSLETARKEIVILESQVKDLRARPESNRQFVVQILNEISIELNRARNVLGCLADSSDEGHPTEMDVQSTQADNLRKSVSDLHNAVDRLEGTVMMRTTEKDLMKELAYVKDEKNVLSNKLIYLQEKLNDILEERQVLEDIGADTRKELTALVLCLSAEREEKISISSEHSEMQAKLQQADNNETALLNKIRNLEQECEKLCEKNRRLEMKVDGFNTSSDKDEILVACTPAIETPGKEKQMTLESLCTDYKKISAVCGQLENRNKILEDEKNSLVEEMYAYKKKLNTQNQDLLAEVKNKEQHLKNMHQENIKLSEMRKTLEAQLLHLDREVMLLKDRVVCSETEKERLEDANRQQQNEIQEIYLHRSKDNVVREKLENLFYENTKLKEQKRMLVTRLQSLERDIKSQLMAIRNLQNEKEELNVQLNNVELEKRKEESHINHLTKLLDRQEEKSRKEVDVLTKKLKKHEKPHEKDELCKESPDLDKIASETSKEEHIKNKGIIDNLKEENATLVKENNLLRRACEKLKENRKAASKRLDSSNMEQSPRISSRHIQGSKQSSFSSFDRTSLSNSQHSFSADKPDRGRDSTSHDYSQQETPLANQTRRSSSRDADATSICSQECYCSPILSVVNLCPIEIQQSTDLSPSQQCPKCSKKKKTSVVISEHYV